MVVKKLAQLAKGGNGGNSDLLNDLTGSCSLSELQSRIQFMLSLAADVLKLKRKEQYLTFEERKALRMMEQDLKLWIEDTNKKCFGFDKITLEDLYKELESEPDLLEKISRAQSSALLAESQKTSGASSEEK